MLKRKCPIRGLTIGAVLMLTAALSGAQDPAVVNPKTVRVKLENDRVRVLEAVLQPGDKELLHSHPPSVIYVIDGGKTRNHTPDGKSSELELKSEEALYRDAFTHWAENTGDTTIHLIVVELKNAR